MASVPAGGLLCLLMQLLLCSRSAGHDYPPGHPCNSPALASKPFCDASLTTAQRAAAMAEGLAAMQAALPSEDTPHPRAGLNVANKNTALKDQLDHVEAASPRAPAPPYPPTDPGLERLELTAGFGLGCVSACFAVLLTALRAAWRDGMPGPRELQQGNLTVAKDVDVSSHIDDASTSELLAELDEIIAASGGGSTDTNSHTGVDGRTPRTGTGSTVKEPNNKGKRASKDSKGGVRSMKSNGRRGHGGTSGDRTATTGLSEVQSLLESIAQSEELTT